MNPLLNTDAYKIGHYEQYPPGTKYLFTNWTPRGSRVPGVNKVVHMGLQYFVKKVLIEEFNKNFFERSLPELVSEYKGVISQTLGIAEPRVDHIEALHKLGYLPIRIFSLPEGTSVPIGIPALVMYNTHPGFFWLPTYLETIMSAYLWKPSTSATTAMRYKRICKKWAKVDGGDSSYLAWQCHDFSFRGMNGVEDAILSGLGHLACFSGSDTIPTIIAAHNYYGASLSCGGSVPATEHSVMCAGTKDDELSTFKRLITEVYPKGIVSIVSDTWDLWKVCTEYVPALKDIISARDGKVVIRPDSSPKTPVEILCGDPEETGPAQEGVVQLLANALGTNTKLGGLPRINKAAAIYGDAITPERAEEILRRLVTERGLSPANVVFGCGSFSYTYCTRDTYGFAMKATAVSKGKGWIPIFKKPITDSGTKHSRKGVLDVVRENGQLVCKEHLEVTYVEDNSAFQPVFVNGKLMNETTLDEIRARIDEELDNEQV